MHGSISSIAQRAGAVDPPWSPIFAGVLPGESDVGTPIFAQPWFKTIAHGDDIRQVHARDGHGALVCTFSYAERRRFGLFSRITSLDKWRRIWAFQFHKAHLSEDEKRDAVRAIVEQLPNAFAHYEFVLDDDSGLLADALAAGGFSHVKMPKYVRAPSGRSYRGLAIEDAYLRATSDVLRSISKDARTRTEQAKAHTEITELSASDFIRFYEESLRLAKRHSYAPLSVVRDLVENAALRGNALILAAVDKTTKEIEAAAVFALDATTSYGWLASRKYYASHRKFTGADAYKKYLLDMLVIEAMIFAEMHQLAYDAEIIPIDATGAPLDKHRVFVCESMLRLKNSGTRYRFRRTGPIFLCFQDARRRLRDITKLPRAALREATPRHRGPF